MADSTNTRSCPKAAVTLFAAPHCLVEDSGLTSVGVQP